MVDFKTRLKPEPAKELAARMFLAVAPKATVFKEQPTSDQLLEVAASLEVLITEDRARCVHFYRHRIALLFKVLGADMGECTSCGAQVWWLRMPSGKPNPYNKDGASHFADCKQAAEHRKAKP